MTRLTRAKSFDWKRRSACANQQGQSSRRRDSPNLFPAICSLTLDKNDGNSDDVKVEGTVMATRLLGNFGRYGIQLFHILYKTGEDNNNNNEDNDEEDNDDDAKEVDGMPMTIAWPTTPNGWPL